MQFQTLIKIHMNILLSQQTRKEKIAILRAWLIHIYTALGGVLGVLAMFEAVRKEFAASFFLLFLTMIIDSTDGMLARKFKIKKVLPQFDGSTLDNVVDTLTFAWVPILLMYQMDIVSNPAILLIPTVATLYAYGQSNMKSEEGFFIGFPTYWSVVALYMWMFNLSDSVSTAIIVICGILSFVPTRYLYPSKNAYLRNITWPLTAFWFIIVLRVLMTDTPNSTLAHISIIYPIYYIVVSFYVEFKMRFLNSKKVTFHKSGNDLDG